MADVQALQRRLRSPRRTEQRHAAQAVEGLAADGSWNACEVLLAGGCLAPLAEMLGSDSHALQRAAAGAMSCLTAGSPRMRAGAATAIPALVTALSSAGEHAVILAAVALSNLADESPQRCSAIVAAGGHTALVRLCASDSSDVRRAACHSLANIATLPGGKAALLEAGALPALASVLRRPDTAGSGVPLPATGTTAAHVVANLCLGSSGLSSPATPAMVAAAVAATAAGVPAALVVQLRTCTDADTLLATAHALGCLAHSGDEAVCGAVLAAGGITVLAQRLRGQCRSPAALAAIVRTLGRLAADSSERSAAVAAEPGVLPRLAQLMAGAAGEEAQAMAVALCSALAEMGQQAAVAAAVPETALATALRAAQRGGPANESLVVLGVCGPRLVTALAAAGRLDDLLSAGVDRSLRQLAASSSIPTVQRNAAAALANLTTPRSSPAAPGSSSSAAAASEPASAAEPASQPPQRPRRTCDAPDCGVTAGLRLCGGCGTTRYCSQACSRAHWKAHRAECRRLQAEKAAAAGPAAGSASGSSS